MQIPADHPDEAERIALLERCHVLDTIAEPEFDGLVQLASELLAVPISLISLVDRERQWFKAKLGLSAPQTARAVSFCGHAILGDDEPFIVEDSTKDPRFSDNPIVVGEPCVMFYAGVPLRIGPQKLPVGTLCAIDHRPRSMTPEQIQKLKLLARQAELVFELRLRQRELEERLIESRRGEEYIQAVVSTMDEGLTVQRLDGSIVSCNPAAERILGLTADQMTGRSSLDPRWGAVRADGSEFPGSDHPSMVAMRTGKPVRSVVMGVGVGDSDRRWVLINAQPTRTGPQHAVDGVVVSFSDITALRREEAERRRAEEQVERFFTLSLDLLCIANAEGRFVRLNPSWTAVLGWSLEELLARPFVEFVHPDDRERTLRVAARLAEGATSVDFENRYACRDGSWRVLSWAGAGVPATGLLMCVARDITLQKENEVELRRAKEAAEASTRAANEFLATMSHEIRTPMNGVIGLTEVVLGTSLASEQREMLQSVRDSGKALLEILNAILDWSRIEAGRLELERAPVDVVKIVRDVVAVLTPQAAAKGLRLSFGGSAKCTVLGDAGRLRQVLFNLAGNAVKFTANGQVAIRIAVVPPSPEFPLGLCQLSVDDTGIGIPREAVDRLFQRFSQVDASTTRRFGGTGLGLAISRELVQSMGGTVEVDSVLGQGSTFQVTLPLAEEDVALEPAPQGQAGPAARTRVLRILLAEDNTVNQRVATALLKRDGHEVQVASNGREAVDAYARGPWDLVLMDVRMPEMDGLSASRAIRENERASGARRVPIIALTASAMPDERSACLGAGMDEVLAKPITGDELRAVLRNVA